jgi:hypothetical protein
LIKGAKDIENSMIVALSSDTNGVTAEFQFGAWIGISQVRLLVLDRPSVDDDDGKVKLSPTGLSFSFDNAPLLTLLFEANT